jgi:hypothetical protein
VKLPHPLTALSSTTPQRVLGAAVAAVAAVALTVTVALLVFAGRDTSEAVQLTPAQAAALARLTPYAELLADDFDSGVAALPAELVRDVSVAADGLSASGLITLPVGDGTCAAVRVEIGPAYLIDGDVAALEVTGPVLLRGAQCPTSG